MQTNVIIVSATSYTLLVGSYHGRYHNALILPSSTVGNSISFDGSSSVLDVPHIQYYAIAATKNASISLLDKNNQDHLSFWNKLRFSIHTSPFFISPLLIATCCCGPLAIHTRSHPTVSFGRHALLQYLIQGWNKDNDQQANGISGKSHPIAIILKVVNRINHDIKKSITLLAPLRTIHFLLQLQGQRMLQSSKDGSNDAIATHVFCHVSLRQHHQLYEHQTHQCHQILPLSYIRHPVHQPSVTPYEHWM
ncbi:predicted protein [Lichtheimia corymbifera JMRC:FSU:9682]|uniref:Uncharacterized protein n=1 Tax=Lichtheimia corymbifera JMRC:FSU:9682 TaxID=1263082 RepID=A0A068RVH5_9FUNG|nr:predicted protein [Lichtheimia corymbifera JMRC:FSU:9682]